MTRLLLALSLTVVGFSAHAQTYTRLANLHPVGFCQLTLTAAAAKISTCTGGIPAGANVAMMTLETANARWRDDGTAPTTSIGMLMQQQPATSSFTLPFFYGGDLTAIQFIAVTGSPVLDISFYRW